MVSKLKQRRIRRLKADVAWWRSEAEYCKARVFEQANEIAELKSMVIRIPMPVMVPVEILRQLNGKSSKESPLCRNCNDGTRHGCSSCSYRMK